MGESLTRFPTCLRGSTQVLSVLAGSFAGPNPLADQFYYSLQRRVGAFIRRCIDE